MKYEFAVFIGRFQIFHETHLKILQKALSIAPGVLVILGSSRSARTMKNPFTAEERMEMIRACLPKDDRGRVHFLGVRDYLYNDHKWLAEVQQKVGDTLEPVTGKLLRETKIALVGAYSDQSSYYLQMFPQWKLEETPHDSKAAHATDLRDSYLHVPYCNFWKDHVPQPVIDYLEKFKDTEHYTRLVEEAEYVKSYKRAWEKSPYPPTFVTADAVVYQSGHVLVVKRKMAPGKGMIALPGGFVGQDEKVLAAMLRELKEETGIRVPMPILKSSIIAEKVFDHPSRSLRGRTITHAFFIKLEDGELPQVKGSDDAEKAWWMPVRDLYIRENEFFEDHVHIIGYGLSKVE